MNVLQYILTNPPILKACNSPYMQYYFKRFFCFAFLGSYIFISDKKSSQKAIEIGIAFFHSLGNHNGQTLDYFFYASHIRHNLPYKMIPISMSLVEIFLKLSTKTGQMHLIIWTTLDIKLKLI